DQVVQVGRTVGAELDLAALDVGHGLGGVHGDGAGLRVGHEAAGAQHATQTTDLAHQVRCSHGRVEVGPAAGDPLDQLVAADLVGAGLPGGVGLRTGREDDDAGGLAGAVGQVDGATHQLIGLAAIHAQTHGDLDGG